MPDPWKNLTDAYPWFLFKHRWTSQNLLIKQTYWLLHCRGRHTCIFSGYSFTGTCCVRRILTGCIISWNDGKDSYRAAHFLIMSKHRARHDNLLMHKRINNLSCKNCGGFSNKMNQLITFKSVSSIYYYNFLTKPVTRLFLVVNSD